MSINPLAQILQAQQKEPPTTTESLMARNAGKQPPMVDPKTGLPQNLIGMLAKIHVDRVAEEWANKKAQEAGQQPMPTVAETAGKKAEQLIQSELAKKFAQNNPPQMQGGLPAAAQAAPPQAMAQGGLTRLGSNLPKSYAGGGIIAFSGADGSYVEDDDLPLWAQALRAQRRQKENAAETAKLARLHPEYGDAEYARLQSAMTPPTQEELRALQAPAPAQSASAAEAAMRTQVQGDMGADPAAIRRELAATMQGLKEVTNPQDRAQLQAYAQDLQRQLAAIGSTADAAPTTTVPPAQSTPDLAQLTQATAADLMRTSREEERRKALDLAEQYYGKRFTTLENTLGKGLADLDAAYKQQVAARPGVFSGFLRDAAGAAMAARKGGNSWEEFLGNLVSNDAARTKGYSDADLAHLREMMGGNLKLSELGLGAGKTMLDTALKADDVARSLMGQGLTSGTTIRDVDARIAANAEQASATRASTQATRELAAQQRRENLAQHEREFRATMRDKLEKEIDDAARNNTMLQLQFQKNPELRMQMIQDRLNRMMEEYYRDPTKPIVSAGIPSGVTVTRIGG